MRKLTEPETRESLTARFWRYVHKSRAGACWIWLGGRTVYGYGYVSVGASGQVKAHRLSWELHNGTIPDGLCVLHRCDVRACINPDHLWLGTRGDNTRDMFAKGRNVVPRGERSGSARLSVSDVLAIRAERLSGQTYQRLADRFGVSRSAIQYAVSGRNWAHVGKDG